MFDNIGGKIKSLAIFVCGLGMVGSIIYAILIWSQNSRQNNTILSGIIVLVVGCLASWIGSFFTYGFGQLIENSEDIKDILKNQENEKPSSIAVVTTTEKKGNETKTTTTYRTTDDLNREKKILAEGGWKCPNCGELNHHYVSSCCCGKNKREALQEQANQTT